MDNWRTPPEVFDPLNAEFNFECDAAADGSNTLCPVYLNDALRMDDWPARSVWLNPPYGRMLDPFIRRAAIEAGKGKTIVALIPMRTRAAWWHEAVIGKANEVRCVRKRVRFLSPAGVRAKYTLSCDSAVVVWDSRVPHQGTRLTAFTQG